MSALKSFFWDAFVNGLLASRIVGYRLRGFFLNLLGCRIPRDSAVHSGCHITGRRLSIGHGSYVNRNCLIDCRHAEVVIGDRVGIAYSCQFLTTQHDYGNPAKRTGSVSGARIEVGDGVWLGGGCLVCPGVKIASGAVIAAGSVVTKDCAENALYGGNPARLIRKLSSNPAAVSGERKAGGFQHGAL